jgi:hypothetical protein|tara:strand:+ start:880 stop:1080 length:201 start_codon:yes stop_codon:yes gene_type:complete
MSNEDMQTTTGIFDLLPGDSTVTCEYDEVAHHYTYWWRGAWVKTAANADQDPKNIARLLKKQMDVR